MNRTVVRFLNYLSHISHVLYASHVALLVNVLYLSHVGHVAYLAHVESLADPGLHNLATRVRVAGWVPHDLYVCGYLHTVQNGR